MSFERDDVLAKIGKRVQLHDAVSEHGRMDFSPAVPHGTMGTVIHANLVYRFTHEAYGPADLYELVIEWDSLNRRIDMFDESAYRWFITELA